MNAWYLAGAAFIITASVIYSIMLIRFRESFLGLSKWQTFATLISHVPDDDSPAYPHVVAGVLTCLGLCLIAGASISSLPFVSKNLNLHATALTAGGLSFGVLISVVSFWTLWQTKRIEQIQGSTIEGFAQLIAAITQEVERIHGDFQSNKGRARPHHRFLLVTTNPYFGLLSDRHGETTEDFEDSLKRIARDVHRSLGIDTQERFQMEILCGDEKAISTFHQIFYRPRGQQVADSSDPAVCEANNETEKFIQRLNEDAGTQVFFRAREIPKTQFAIVGNTVFEFILESPGSQSEIHQARRIRDKVVCDRFRDTFQILKRLGQAATG